MQHKFIWESLASSILIIHKDDQKSKKFDFNDLSVENQLVKNEIENHFIEIHKADPINVKFLTH
jgi:hypothetical protein